MYTVYPILRTDSTPVVLIKLSCLTQPLPTSSVGSYTDRQVMQYTADRAVIQTGERRLNL